MKLELQMHGVLLCRIGKRMPTIAEESVVSLALVDRIADRSASFFGNIRKAHVYWPHRNATTRDLTWLQSQIEIVAGGSFYWDGRVMLVDGEKLTLEERRNYERLRKQLGE